MSIRTLFSSTSRFTRPQAASSFAYNTVRLQQPPRLFTNTAFRMADKTTAGEVHNIVSNEEYKKLITESKGVVMLDCFAEWCGPCKMIAPHIDKLASQRSDVKFYKFDIDALPDIAQELSVSSIPTFKFFKDGELVDDVVGAKPAAIEAAITKAVA